MSKPLIAIVGRPNVGKSTLFNRIVGRRAAVVSEVPGTTRDRISLDAQWEGRSFIIVDTGGLEPEPTSSLSQQVAGQVEVAIESADSIIFLTDVRDGLTPADMEIGQRLRQAGKPVILAASKADNETLDLEAAEFYRLGLGDPIPISAYHNRGIEALMGAVLEKVPAPPPEATEPEDLLSLAIVGRPNVGKSALLNAILGEQRVIVSEVPGTTRDAIDIPTTYQSQRLLLVDTAGLRRPGRVVPGIEKYSVLRAIQAIDRSDVVFIVLDASDLATAQDTHIAGQAVEAFKGAVILVNKWDLAPTLGLDQADCLAFTRDQFKFMAYAPIRFVSALHGTGVTDALETALMVYRERCKVVPRRDLSSAVMAAMAEHPPPSRGKRFLRLKGVAQERVNPPTFVFHVNDASLLHFSYHRYLENRLREALGFRWNRLKLVFHEGGDGERRHPRAGIMGEAPADQGARS